MSKLPKEHEFIDLSDYGRPFARIIANSLNETSYTPIDFTIWFIILRLIAIVCILIGDYWASAFFLISKLILDAADRELLRVKKTRSHTVRYLDSVADIVLNLFIFIAPWSATEANSNYSFFCIFGD